MVVVCYASDVKAHDRRTPELTNAALHIKLDANSIEKKTVQLTCKSVVSSSQRISTRSSPTLTARTGRAPLKTVATFASINACGNQESAIQVTKAFCFRISLKSTLNNSEEEREESLLKARSHSKGEAGGPV